MKPANDPADPSPAPPSDSSRRRGFHSFLRFLPFVSSLIALILVVGLLWRAGFDPRQILTLVETTNPLAFFLLMATLPVLGFPISIFYIFAAAAFPAWQALLLSLAALAINMSASYFLARTILKPYLTRFLGRRGWSVPQLPDRHHARAVFVFRALPTPFGAQNYLLGLAGIPFPLFISVSLLTQGAMASLFIFLGEAVLELGQPALWIALSIAALIYSLVKSLSFLRRRFRARQERVLEDVSQAPHNSS